MLGDLGVPRYELAELAHNAPSVADAIARLYAALKEAGRNPSLASDGDARALVTPENWVRDYIQQHRNHYPELEQGAETLGGALSDPLSMAEPMRRRLKEAWGIARAGRAARPSWAMSASSTIPSGGCSCCRRSCAPRTAPSRSPISWRWSNSPRVLDRMVAEAAPPDEGVAPAAPHEPRQLCRRRDHDALWPLPRQRRAVSLLDRPAVRRIWRQCRAGRAPADHARAGPARAACPSSCCGSIRPGTSPSAMPARISPSRASAAPARAGTSTPPSRPPGRSSPS